MTAMPEEVQGAIAEGCEVMELMAPTHIEKDEEGKVAALWAQPQIIGEVRGGRPTPKAADAPKVRLECDTVMVAIGRVLNLNPLRLTESP